MKIKTIYPFLFLWRASEAFTTGRVKKPATWTARPHFSLTVASKTTGFNTVNRSLTKRKAQFQECQEEQKPITAKINETKQSMQYGILLSSFTDGLRDSAPARDFLKFSLLSTLLQHHIHELQIKIEDSVKYSPCAGPNIELLNELEYADKLLQQNDEHYKNDGNQMRNEITKKIINHLTNSPTFETSMTNIRVVYIPTAMYALRADSNNTPGKQRQRARADGKKRRNQFVNFINELFQEMDWDVTTSAITLDLDDASLKQPSSTPSDTTDDENTCSFPTDGKEVLADWNPHICYVEGGNTFWLQHCIDKGHWSDLIVDTLVNNPTPAIYIGKSAGAIIAGKKMETATWKGWDNPSIVPSRETYDDWIGQPGLNLAGDASFFPHMNDEWIPLVTKKRLDIIDELEEESSSSEQLYCLEEHHACCIQGDIDRFIVKGQIE